MGGSPSAPNPVDTSRAQTGTNIGTALANTFMGQVNQNTPYGRLRYNQTGNYSFTDPYTQSKYDIPTFTATTSLTPGGQRIQNATMGAQENYARAAQAASGQVAGQYGQPFRYAAGTPGLTTGPSGTSIGGNAGLDTSAPTSRQAGALTRSIDPRTGMIQSGPDARIGMIQSSYDGADDFGQQRNQVVNALMQRMRPEQERARSAADANLIARGVGIGSQAYGDTMSDIGRQENDARLGAILAGGQEQSRLVGLARDAAAFNNDARGQQFGQQLASQQASNAAAGQRFGQTLSAGQFGNQAQQQRYGQMMDTYGAQNDALQQAYQNRTGAQLTNFNTASEAARNQNAARAQSLQEQYALRNQPLNELGAILGQTGVQAPNFNVSGGSTIPTTDVGGNIWDSYRARLQNAQNRNSGIGSIIGSLAGLGMGL